jgi:AbrB family looped-hinge helix DNA binding protein
MSLVTVKRKFQIAIPAGVCRKAGIRVGDLLDATAQQGKIVFSSKTIVNREIAEGLEDVRQGRTYGPYDSPNDMIRALRSAAVKGRKKPRRK